MLIDADLTALNDPVTLTHDLLNRFRGTVRRTIPLTGFRFFLRVRWRRYTERSIVIAIVYVHLSVTLGAVSKRLDHFTIW